MSIVERPPPPVAPASPSERLRVITAGRVGHIDARLGTSGFDVVAVAGTEDELIVAVSADEPDAIVVEADLCDSLERVRDLAPDAVLIVVGDHTPAGALGRIERGVSGTVLAGLLHALVAEGVAGAAVWGFVPALGPSTPHVPAHVSGSLLSAKAELVAKAIHEHTGLVAAVGTVVVTASASLLLTLSSPRTHERAERAVAPSPVVIERAPDRPVVVVTPSTEPPAERPSDEAAPGDRSDPSPGASTGPVVHDEPPADHGSPPSVEPPPDEVTPPPEDSTPPPEEETPPPDEETPPPEEATPPPSVAVRPPGVAKGWDHRPPKHEDNGNQTGWTNNSVPEDHPPGRTGG
jgi:hypothetical protein